MPSTHVYVTRTPAVAPRVFELQFSTHIVGMEEETGKKGFVNFHIKKYNNSTEEQLREKYNDMKLLNTKIQTGFPLLWKTCTVVAVCFLILIVSGLVKMHWREWSIILYAGVVAMAIYLAATYIDII